MRETPFCAKRHLGCDSAVVSLADLQRHLVHSRHVTGSDSQIPLDLFHSSHRAGRKMFKKRGWKDWMKVVGQ